MGENQRCPRCGSEIPADAPGGDLCPKCLIKEGLKTSDPTRPRSSFVPPDPSELTTRFPHLEILEIIGQGGMGVVYQARQIKLDRLVALKILTPELASNPEKRERLEREARAAASLNHPGIAVVHEVGEAEVQHLIASVEA